MSLKQLNKHLLMQDTRKAIPSEMPPANLPKQARKTLNKIQRKQAADNRKLEKEGKKIITF